MYSGDGSDRVHLSLRRYGFYIFFFRVKFSNDSLKRKTSAGCRSLLYGYIIYLRWRVLSVFEIKIQA